MCLTDMKVMTCKLHRNRLCLDQTSIKFCFSTMSVNYQLRFAFDLLFGVYNSISTVTQTSKPFIWLLVSDHGFHTVNNYFL